MKRLQLEEAQCCGAINIAEEEVLVSKFACENDAKCVCVYVSVCFHVFKMRKVGLLTGFKF